MESPKFRVYLVDDEPLAIERLARLLAGCEGIEVAGSAADPERALAELNRLNVDVVFLDIQMPSLNGFELLTRLAVQPLVVFTTAYDEYALRAFEVNSIDYLLKPIEPSHLTRALGKIRRMHPAAKPNWQLSPDLAILLKQLAESLRPQPEEFPRRIASRVGERITFLDVDSVTHFVAQDKLTYAVVDGKRHSVDQTIAELEQRLNPAKFLRVHRSALLNSNWIQEVNSWFAGKVVVTLKDVQRTQITVARDRVRALKSYMGL